jgi:hypothetical protein
VNCGVGPQATLELLEQFVAAAEGTPVSAMPNAGLPQFVEGRYVYLSSPEYFAEFAARAIALGVRLLGGCCGTTPAHVRAMRERLASHLPAESLPSGAEVRVLEPVAAREGRRRRRGHAVAAALMLRAFTVSVEIDPPRRHPDAEGDGGARLMAARGVDCINIADSPMARIRMSAMALAFQIRRELPSMELILHYTTRDRNLMGLQSELLGAHALGPAQHPVPDGRSRQSRRLPEHDGGLRHRFGRAHQDRAPAERGHGPGGLVHRRPHGVRRGLRREPHRRRHARRTRALPPQARRGRAVRDDAAGLHTRRVEAFLESWAACLRCR